MRLMSLGGRHDLLETHQLLSFKWRRKIYPSILPPRTAHDLVAEAGAMCCQTVYVGLPVIVATVFVMIVKRRTVLVGVGSVM